MFDFITLEAIASVALVALAAIIVVALIFGWRYGIKLLKLELGDKQFAVLENYTKMVVRWLEQSGIKLGYTGAEKKALAVVAITEFAKLLKIPIDPELVDRLVEAAVNIMNNEFGKVVTIDYTNPPEG